MKAIRHKIYGQHLALADGRHALWLQAEGDPGAQPLYLRYALTIRGSETPVFPAFLLDDWGNEIKKLDLYTWLRENGEYYPRAEVFGLDEHGAQTQHFTRELELYFRYPCYLYTAADAPVSAGVRLAAVLLADETSGAPQPARPPADLPPPLRRAILQWWRLPAAQIATFCPPPEQQRA